MPGKSDSRNNSRSQTEQGYTEVIPPSMTELLRQTGPRGFGGFSSEQRYQDLFEDEAESAPGAGYRAGTMGGNYQSPFNGAYTNQPYEDTVLFFHHCKRGIRVSMQANTKTFIILFLIFVALINSPGIGEIVNNLLRTVLNPR